MSQFVDGLGRILGVRQAGELGDVALHRVNRHQPRQHKGQREANENNGNIEADALCDIAYGAHSKLAGIRVRRNARGRTNSSPAPSTIWIRPDYMLPVGSIFTTVFLKEVHHEYGSA